MLNPILDLATENCGVMKYLRAKSAYRQGRIKRALDEAEVDDTSGHHISSLIGTKSPPGLALASNERLREFVVKRSFSAFKQAMSVEPTTNLRFVSAWFEDASSPYSSVNHDFAKLKLKSKKRIKDLSTNVVGVFGISCRAEEVFPYFSALCWDYETDKPRIAERERRGSDLEASLVTTQTVDLDGTSADLARASAALWDVCFVHNAEPRVKKGTLKPPKALDGHLEQELRCLLISSSLRLNELCFSQGAGNAVKRSVMRELKARTSSLDIFNRAPTAEASIPRILAELPLNQDQDRMPLPAIRHL